MNKICVKCGHEACPICKDFCDELIKQEDGAFDLCECFENNGECVYEIKEKEDE